MEGMNNEGLWLFAILALLGFGGNGIMGNGYRGGEQYATSADVQRGFDTNSIEQQVRGIANGIADATYALDNAIAGVGAAVTSEGRALGMQIADGICKNQHNIDGLRFDMANYAAATDKAIHAEGEATRNLIQQNKIDALMQEVNGLKLKEAMCGVVRYPMESAYYIGGSPFCGANNRTCCGNI